MKPPALPVTAAEPLLRDEVQQLLDHFASLMKMQTVFFSPAGTIMRKGRESGNCAYCDLMQQKVFGLAPCLALDRAKLQECAAKGEPITYRCHAGLTEMIAPLQAGGRLMGFVMLGQFRTDRHLPDAAASRIQDPQLGKKAERAFAALPCIAPEELQDLQGVFHILVDYIAARELVQISGGEIAARLEEYLDRHAAEPVTIADAARYLGISVSGLSHQLQKLGLPGFKHQLIEKRLRLAEKRLREEPEIPLAEAAAAAGFEDRFYFSRLYRKYRGFPPGEYRTRSTAARLNPAQDAEPPSPPSRHPSTRR